MAETQMPPPQTIKQGIALTGRNTTGPLSPVAPWRVTLRRRGVLQTTTTDDSEQNNTGPHTLCRRSINNPARSSRTKRTTSYV